MEKLHTFYYILELLGIFAFAISGATAAKQRDLDIFGIFALAFTVSCGGGIIRDICIGAIPPAGLTTWFYPAAAIVATALTVGFYGFVKKLNHPVLLFDAAGLALFAVTGTQKALLYGLDGQGAILLGTMTAVGGGVLRDVLLNRVPVILQKEIYAMAAVVASAIVVSGSYFKLLTRDTVSVIALVVAFVIRILALRFHWNLRMEKINKTHPGKD